MTTKIDFVGRRIGCRLKDLRYVVRRTALDCESCGKLQARCGKPKASRGLKRTDACEKPRRCKRLGRMARRDIWLRRKSGGD
jgi:hypothetical protein